MPNWLNQLLLLRFLRKPYRTLSTWQLLRGKHYHDPRLFGAAIDLERLEAIHWPIEHDVLINAFLYQLLCRKRILVEGGSVESLLAMGWVAVCLIRWYAKALASLQQSDAITEKEVSTAIRLVERYYTGHQPRFFAWFQSPLQSGMLLRCIQWLLQSPCLPRFQPAP